MRAGISLSSWKRRAKRRRTHDRSRIGPLLRKRDQPHAGRLQQPMAETCQAQAGASKSSRIPIAEAHAREREEFDG